MKSLRTLGDSGYAFFFPLFAVLLAACAGPAFPPVRAPADHPKRVYMHRADLTADTPVTVAVRQCEEAVVYVLTGSARVNGDDADNIVVPERSAFRAHGDANLELIGQGQVLIALVDGSTQDCKANGHYGLITPNPRLRYAPNVNLRVDLLLDDTAGAPITTSLEHMTGAPALVVPEHTHPGVAEALYIEAGSGHMKLGNEEIRVAPGMIIYVPPGTVHDLRLDGDVPLEAVQLYAPSGPEQRFKAPAP